MTNPSWTESMRQSLTELGQRVVHYLPAVLGALALLALGWIVARLMRRWTRAALERLQRRLFGRAVEREMQSTGMDRLASEAAGGIVFWLVFLLFLAAAGELLGLDVVTLGLSRLVQYLPNVLGAVLVVLAGLVLGNLARVAVSRAAETAKLGYARSLGQLARGAILLVAGVIGMDQIGIDSELLIAATNVLIASVIGGVALAFALGSRTAVGNLLAMHYVTQTYRAGQRVRVGDVEGEIAEFKKNGVVLATLEGRVLVPAEEFSRRRSTLLAGESR